MPIDGNVWLMEPSRQQAYAERTKILLSDNTLLADSVGSKGQAKKPYEIDAGVAIIDFVGPISSRDDFMSWVMDCAVLPAISKQIKAADSDPDVEAIVLRVDSPGGPPAGLVEFTNTITKTKKPIVGFCDGMTASGALWAASALDAMVISKTAAVGSIGVIAVLEDVTQAAAQAGVKFTVLRAGKYKAAGIRYEALSDEFKAVLQTEIDALYSIFVDEIAENTGRSVDEILKIADGKIFIGDQAVKAGLADKVGFLEDAREMALNTIKGDLNMGEKIIKSVKALSENFPELCAELVAGVDIAAPVTAETDRLLGLVSAFFGDDQGVKFGAVVKSGVTLEQYISIRESVPVVAPVAPVADVAELKAAELKALQDAAPGTVGADADAADGPKNFTEAWKAVKEELNCNTKKAMSVAAKRFPALHAAITGGA